MCAGLAEDVDINKLNVIATPINIEQFTTTSTAIGTITAPVTMTIMERNE